MAKEKKSFVDFKKVKEQVNIEQILEHYGIRDTFDGNGRQIQGACPIHGGGESSTSFSVNLDKNCWNCFGECQSGGNILDLVAELEDCSIRDAALKINKIFKLSNEKPRKGKSSRRTKTGKPAPKDAKTAREDVSIEDSEVCVPEEEIERPNENAPLSFLVLKNLSSDNDALIEREVYSDSAKHFGVGFCSRGLLSGRIAIPIHNPKGKLLAYVGTAKPREDEPYFCPCNLTSGNSFGDCALCPTGGHAPGGVVRYFVIP